jgi:hypothetical protein
VGGVFRLPWRLFCYTECEPLQVSVHIREEQEEEVIRMRRVLWCAQKVLELGHFKAISMVQSRMV